MHFLKVIFLNIIFLAVAFSECEKNLISELSYKLSGCKLAFPCQSTLNIYTSTSRYIQKNVIGTRFQMFKDHAIIAMPRYKPGVPITLGSFCLKDKECRPTLAPFPCWPIQEEGDCQALQSVVDLFLDQTETLWVLDTGIVNTLVQPVKRCPPKILGFNMHTGQVVKVIDLSTLVTSESKLQQLVVDFDSDGRAFIYVSDAGEGAILVYNVSGNTGFRVVLPRAISDCEFKKHVLNIVLVRKEDGNLLYFTYLLSPRLFYIRTSSLQQGVASGAVVDVGPKPEDHGIILLGTDNGCGIFLRYKGQSDIFIWNSLSCFKADNFVLVQKGDDCKLATQVVPGYKKLMWALESNFHDYVANKVGCLGASMVIHPLVKECE